MTYPCIKFIDEATEAHQIREIFKKSYTFIREPDVHKPIFKRIEFLIQNSTDCQKVKDLEDLKEDIEIEIETAGMLTSELKEVSGKKVKRLSYNPKEKFLKMFEKKRVFRGNSLTSKEVMNAISKCGGNKTRAARALGISTRILRNKMKEGEDHGC